MNILIVIFLTGQCIWKKVFGKSTTIKVGDIIANKPNKNGYISIRFKGKKVKLHRVIYSMANGNTYLEIDHINHNKTDNRLCNLRAVTKSLNQKNRDRAVGVYFHKSGGWTAHYRDLSGDRKTKYGFKTFSDAKYFRDTLISNNGYHENCDKRLIK